MAFFYTECLDVWFFFFKQKTAYEMRISDWSSDVCSSDLPVERRPFARGKRADPVEHRIDHVRAGAGEARLGRQRLDADDVIEHEALIGNEIGRASGRERVCQYV